MNKIKHFFLSIIVLLLFIFVYFVTYNFVEPKVYDFMVKNFSAQTFSQDDIVLVVIDDETAERYRWPWKRELFCKIFDYFHDYAHPRAVVHDAIFTTLDAENPESDKKFFNSLKKYDNLVEGFALTTSPWNNDEFGREYNKNFAKKFALKNITVKTNNLEQYFSSLIPFPSPYFNSVKRVGSVNTFQKFVHGISYNDETMRTMDYVHLYDGQIYASLALQTFLALHNDPRMILDKDFIIFPDLNYKIRYSAPLRFYKTPDFTYKYRYTHNMIPAIKIMDSFDSIKNGKKPLVNPDLFKDKIVVIGAHVSASEGLVDIKTSSVAPNHPGVDIQATAIDNIIHNDFMKLIPMWVNIMIMLMGMLFVYYTIRTHEIAKAITLSILTVITYIAISITCFYYLIIISVATTVVMLFATMIIAYIHRYIIENRNKKKIENLLGKYMSEDVMKTLIQNIDNLGLGGKKSTVTVLFSDIRGFTSMSEKLTAEEIMAHLNEYFSEMEPIVRKYNGIINKFIGDAVMAIFGEPINDDRHPENAVRCGYEMLQKLKELNKKWKQEGKQEIEIGVGINTGEVIVGNVGSVNRMEYTVIGDTVNLASRLESYNKQFGTKILISSATYELSKNIAEARKISDVQIRGKADLLDIYEIISVKNEA